MDDARVDGAVDGTALGGPTDGIAEGDSDGAAVVGANEVGAVVVVAHREGASSLSSAQSDSPSHTKSTRMQPPGPPQRNRSSESQGASVGEAVGFVD